MSHTATLQRIHQAVSRRCYLVPVSQAPPASRVVLAQVAALLEDPEIAPSVARRLVHRSLDAGQLDPIGALSALGVIAASPRVRDYAEASRLAGEQELAALDLGGPQLQRNLASADRHRGVIAYLMQRHQIALEWFVRALERERSAENLGNVLCALLALSDLEQALSLWWTVQHRMPKGLAQQLAQRIDNDDDLAILR